MRKIYKNSLATASLFSLLALLPISCDLVCSDNCGCGTQAVVNDFKIISFEMFTVNLQGEELGPDLFTPYNQVLKTFRVKDFEMTATIETSNIGISGIAIACSPLPPKSQEKLKELKIFNTKEVALADGTVLKAGDSLNDLFEINYYFVTDTEPIEDFFSESRTIYLEDYFKLSFIKAPQKQVVIEFSLLFIFENGKELPINSQKLSIE